MCYVVVIGSYLSWVHMRCLDALSTVREIILSRCLMVSSPWRAFCNYPNVDSSPLMVLEAKVSRIDEAIS
jgi:hypothetical protein